MTDMIVRSIATGQDSMTPPDQLSEFDLQVHLHNLHGPIIGGDDLWKLLRYTSVDAFRKSVLRKTAPVETFRIPGRRGRFARTEDIARWLHKLS